MSRVLKILKIYIDTLVSTKLNILNTQFDTIYELELKSVAVNREVRESTMGKLSAYLQGNMVMKNRVFFYTDLSTGVNNNCLEDVRSSYL